MFELVETDLHAVMEEVRERTLRLVAHLDEERLEAVLSPIMSPLAWDLGHVAAYEDLWLNHRLAGRELLREDLAALYDAFETPRQVRGDLQFLRGDELREYMETVRALALEAPVADGELHELVIRHELQHTETMLQAMALAGLMPPSFIGPARVNGSGLEMVEVAEGPVEIGAGPEGFAYDNERPRHTEDDGALHHRPHAGDERDLAARSPRAAVMSGANGGPTRAGRGKRSTTSPTTPAPRPGIRTRLSSTSPGSRPTPSPAPTRRACRRRSSGRRRRPGVSSRGPARSGSGRRVTSRATPVSSRARIGSTPKCSSATATGCCAAVHAPRIRASPPRSSVTGTSPNAGSSSPESGSRDEDRVR